jgi:hypothetical protein
MCQMCEYGREFEGVDKITSPEFGPSDAISISDLDSYASAQLQKRICQLLQNGYR